MAAKMVKVVYTDVQPPILTMEDAIEKESIFPDQAECIILGNADGMSSKIIFKKSQTHNSTICIRFYNYAITNLWI